jgi:hypothetical protein
MIFSSQFFRKAINRFTLSAPFAVALDGGCFLKWDDCPLRLFECAEWGPKTYIIEYVFDTPEKQWEVKLLDSPYRNRRLLQLVEWTGDSEEIKTAFRDCQYLR